MTTAVDVVTEPKVHLWTREEYHKMAEARLFLGQGVELIEGEVIDMSPVNSPHRTSVTLASDTIRAAFGKGHFVQVQSPMGFGSQSEPQPDVAVIPGTPRDYKDAHPAVADLIVEVADSSLSYDRTVKASLYAKAGIAGYWLINLNERRLEVYRRPIPDGSARYGFSYAEIIFFTEADSVTPLAKPEALIAVADLLP